MDITYTVKLKYSEKNKHKVPEFKKGLGRGVLEIRTVDFIGAKKKDLKSPMFLKQIYEMANQLIEDWIEVKIETTKKKKKIKKQ